MRMLFRDRIFETTAGIWNFSEKPRVSRVFRTVLAKLIFLWAFWGRSGEKKIWGAGQVDEVRKSAAEIVR